jgi:CheY-like chemotaxis protein
VGERPNVSFRVIPQVYPADADLPGDKSIWCLAREYWRDDVAMFVCDDATTVRAGGQGLELLDRSPQEATDTRRLHGEKTGARTPRISMSRTILLVDDDDAVRELFARMLRSTYEVLEACSSKQARQRFDEHQGKIDLLICDVVMPGGNGPQLAEALIQVDPALRLLYVSGYPPDTEVLPGYPAPHIDFLQKPFSGRQLVARVAVLLAN